MIRKGKISQQSVSVLRQPVDLQKRFRDEMECRLSVSLGILTGFIHTCAEAAEHVFYQYCNTPNVQRRTVKIRRERIYSYALKVWKPRQFSYNCPCGHKRLSVDFHFCPMCGTALHWYDNGSKPDGTMTLNEALEAAVNRD